MSMAVFESTAKFKPKSPARVAAGERNRQLRGPLRPEGRERLRQAALRNEPWQFSTGPRTEEGKARVAMNGRKHKKGDLSIRERRALTADIRSLIAQTAKVRRQICSQLGG